MNRKLRRAASKSVSTAGLLATGLGHHQAGQLAAAEACYRRALASRPEDADALHLLGTALQDQNRVAEAVDAYQRAIALAPGHVEAHADLGNALQEQSRFEEAAAAYRAALRLRPDYAEIASNLGVALRRQGRNDDAIAAFRHSIALKPDYAEAYSNLGAALMAGGEPAAGIDAYRQAIAIKPGYAEAHANLGAALQEQGENEAAIAACRRAIALKPDYAEGHANLGNALRDLHRTREAVAAYRRAIALRPDHAVAWSNLGMALRDQGRLTEAVEAYRQSIRLAPDLALAHINLGNALQDQGRLDDAASACRHAMALDPSGDAGSHAAHSNLLMCLHYATAPSRAALYEEAAAFGRRAAGRALPAAQRDTQSRRPLRVGYVSADFRNHPVGYFLAPVLAAHDPDAVEVFCYANHTVEDAMTARLRSSVAHWRGIAGLSDADAASLIRRDGIDILVDLAGHTAGNRLSLFALRPAPVQATWLGYFDTTGLETIDYILADRFVAPEDEDRFFTETVWRLPDTYLCYMPHDIAIEPGPPPALTNGFVTFGCFNNHAKTTPETVRAWAALLHRVEGAMLFLKNRSLADPAVTETLVSDFAAHGIPRDRLILEAHSPLAEFLGAYHRIDIALDPFPFGGGTTTAEALWMGVPVVTLRGERWVGRMSAAMLTMVGLPDLVATDANSYVTMAAILAGDTARLGRLHADLRQMLETSSLCDGPRFAHSLEAAYRDMWDASLGRLIPSATHPETLPLPARSPNAAPP